MVEMAIGDNVLSNLVGYRFHPTDQEIISYYLKNKMLGLDHLVLAIPEVDICKHDPWELPNFSLLESDDPEWFFFTTLDLKHGIGSRLNRQTRNGFWKPTGNGRKIKDKKTKKVIGTKKTLVFHQGRVPNATRTNWVINEYHSVENHPQKTMYVVCLLKKKDDDKVDKLNGDPQSGQTEPAIPEALPVVPNEGLPLALPLQEPNYHHPNWETDMDELLKFLNSAPVDPFENELQPPNSSWTGESSNSGFPPQILMLRNVEGNTLHLRYVEQDKIDRCIEFSGQANSGRAMSRIRLQRRIGNPAGNPIKAEESSKYTWNSKNGKGTRSPSEYFMNFIVGIVLLIALAREMVLYGEWGM